MRKQNSEFITAFSSEADQALQNTDSFAYVELDELACYVIADGIDDKVDAKSARLAVDSVIAAFTEAPSMKKSALRRYITIANKALTTAKSKRRLKASVTIIVHNYVKMRYAQAGNTRLSLYRGGFLREHSIDQSLSMDMVIETRLEKDKLAEHQERNNLYCYLGQEKDFSPFISKKIKLTNNDAIALYTRGIWENVDEGELTDVFADASNEPEETVHTVEDLLFSKQPEILEKYTLVVLFVNKIFENPNRKRRIKRILAVAIPLLLIIITLTVVLVIRHNKRIDNINNMNSSFLNAVEYVQADNYIRAKEKCKEAQDLAIKLKDSKMKEETNNYLRLIESIIAGDDFLNNSQYENALTQYQNALNQARYADNVGVEYISDRLERTSNYMSVYEMIALGDILAKNLQYDKAEEKYLEAKALASRIYFDKGREAAMSALEKLYGDVKALKENSEKETQQKAEQQAGAAGILANGDKAYAEGSYEDALVYYLTALQKYEDLGDSVQAEAMQKKVESTQQKLNMKTDKIANAEDYILQAEACYAEPNYVQAKKYYLLAQDVYAQIKDDDKVAEISRKINLLDLEMTEAEKEKAEKEKAEKEKAEKAAESAEAAAKESAADKSPVIGPGV